MHHWFNSSDSKKRLHGDNKSHGADDLAAQLLLKNNKFKANLMHAIQHLGLHLAGK